MPKYKRSDIYKMSIPGKDWQEFMSLMAEAERRGDVEADCESGNDKRERQMREAYDKGRFDDLIAKYS